MFSLETRPQTLNRFSEFVLLLINRLSALPYHFYGMPGILIGPQQTCLSVLIVASHADVLRGSSSVPQVPAGTRDEPLRTSAWEATLIVQMR